MTKKRVGVISDIHCGSRVGLTPPEHQYKITKADTAKHNKYARLQHEAWSWFEKNVTALKPFDVLICNGDMIDGPGIKEGGTEQIYTDREIQIQMASEVIDTFKAKHKFLVYGTPFHTGYGEDWESLLAQMIGAKIGSHEWIDINGVVFDCKHKSSRSIIPHGRLTPLARDVLWSDIWAQKGLTPKSAIIIRSHVHYFTYCGGSDWLALTTPCLKTMGDKYGSRQCSGIIDYGFIYFDIYSDSTYDWNAVIANLNGQRATVSKV